MNAPNRYRYEVLPEATFLLILYYLGLSAWMAHWAKGDAELRVGYIALSVTFGALALVVLVRRLAFPCTLELTDDAILLPRGHPWPRITTIPYADIISIQVFGDSLCINTGRGSFEIGNSRFEGDRAVREIISVKTAIELEPLSGTGLDKIPKLLVQWNESPKPLVQWVAPDDWRRFRNRAEITKPVLYQLRTELRFFVRCYAFCCAFIIVPCLGFVVLPWHFSAGPFQLVDIFIRSFAGVFVLAIIFTTLHWLFEINPVRSETKISFRDRGITEQLANGQRFDWNYHQFCGWAVIERQFQGRILQILLLKRLEKGRACNEEIALPDAGVRDQVLQILSDRQVPHAPDLKPSWEVE